MSFYNRIINNPEVEQDDSELDLSRKSDVVNLDPAPDKRCGPYGVAYRDVSSTSNFIEKKRIAAVNSAGKFVTDALEERVLLLNLSSAFYKVFGVRYNIYYYPLNRVFESDTAMQELASGAITYLKTFITRQNLSLI